MSLLSAVGEKNSTTITLSTGARGDFATSFKPPPVRKTTAAAAAAGGAGGDDEKGRPEVCTCVRAYGLRAGGSMEWVERPTLVLSLSG